LFVGTVLYYHTTSISFRNFPLITPRYTAVSKGFATAMQYLVTALVVNQNIMIAGIVLLNIQYYIVSKKSAILVSITNTI